MNKISLTGVVFGRLTVIEKDETKNDGRSRWLCRCECGSEKIVRSDALKSKRTRSCGCLQKDLLVKRKPRKTHGKSNKRLYTMFHNMQRRCYDEDHVSFHNYGGKGISVSKEWRNDFKSFYKWAVENGYSDNLTIDRINNENDYSPTNCRFITHKEQQNNRKDNVFVNYEGESRTISQWAEFLNVEYSTLQTRLKRGWSIERALNTPVRKGDYKRSV